MKESASSVADNNRNNAMDSNENTGESCNFDARIMNVRERGGVGTSEGKEGVTAGETNSLSRIDPIVRNLFPAETEERELTRKIVLPGEIQVGRTPGGQMTSRTWGSTWAENDEGRDENGTSMMCAVERNGSDGNETMKSTQQSATAEHRNCNAGDRPSHNTSYEDNQTVSMSE